MHQSPLVLSARAHVRGLTALLLAGVLAVTLSGPGWTPAASARAPVGAHDTAQAPQPGATRAAGEVGLLPQRRPRARIRAVAGRPREVGMRFGAKVRGTVVGIRYFQAARTPAATPRSATLWSPSGRVLARAPIARTTGRGWRSVRFASPVTVPAGRGYVVSVHTRRSGLQAATRGDFRRARDTRHLRAPAGSNGVVRLGDRSGFPTRPAVRDTNFWVDVRFVPAGTASTPPPSGSSPGGAWPGPGNTGVPAGTTLRAYTGPCTITTPRTLTAVDVKSACGALLIHTRGVVIEKSRLPRVQSIYGDGDSSVTITDSEVRAGATSTGALWGYNITARRVEATGGQHSFHCNDNCVLEDSWLHGQHNPAGQSYHNNAFISNGGTNMLLRHNTLHCTAILNRTDGGCTADVSLFGDFGPISRVTVDNNLLRANNSSISYCAYGGHQPAKRYPVATHVVFTDNVFERGPNRRCGVYGPVTSFQRGAVGNHWSGNRWSSGEPVSP